jgi:RND family efflux transporter MFP subunit
MKRHAAVLVLLAAAIWAIATNGRSDAFQPQPRARGAQPNNTGAAPSAPNRAAPERTATGGVQTTRKAVAQPAQQTDDSRPKSDAPPASVAGTVVVERSVIEPIDQVTLASDVPGIIAELPFREGDEVPAERLVARLRDEIPKAALQTARKLADTTIEEQYAAAAHEVAAATVDKAEMANEKVFGAVPVVEVLRLELDEHRAELQIDKARHDRGVAESRADEAEAQLNAYTLKAPFSGVVTRVHKKVGEAVRQGEQIIDLVNTSRVRVEGYIAVSDFWNVKRGNLVRVQIDLPGLRPDIADRVFEGRLVFVDRTVHPVAQRVRVLAELDNPDDLLKGGLKARMTIHPDEMYNADAAPESGDSEPAAR